MAPPPSSRKSIWRRVGMVVLALAALLLALTAWLYREATAVPEFYAEALARPPSTTPPKVAADNLEKEVLDVQNQLQRAEPWRMVLREEEINAWLVTDAPQKFRNAVPAGIEDRRIVLREDTVYFACKHEKTMGGVLSIVLAPVLSDQPNEIAVRVKSFSLGRLPLPQKQYLDDVAEAAARASLPLRWDDDNGTAVARVVVPDRYEGLRDRTVKIESLEVRDGEMVIEGTAERSRLSQGRTSEAR